MCFAIALDLSDLCDGFPTHARLGIVVVDGVTVIVHGVPHQPVAEVAIVWNGQRFTPGNLFIVGQRGPEILWIAGGLSRVG